MDIYNAEGTLDYGRAANVLSGLTSLTNDAQATLKVQRVQAAALLDIAVSLNALAGIALNDFELGAKDERRTVDDPDDGEDEREVEELDIGDLVVKEADPEPREVGIVTALGFSEGELYAVVRWDRGAPASDPVPGATESKVWLKHLVKLDSVPETFGGGEFPVQPEGVTADDEADARDMVDDLDADFGAAQPVECGAVMILEGVGTVGPCTKKPGHKARKHRDAEGREWLTEASDA